MSHGLIYVRQSSHKPYKAGKLPRNTVSPEVQEEKCRELTAIRACDSVRVIRDLDKSGGSVAKRDGFQTILAEIKSDPPDVIAVYDQSRSFRNTTEALAFYAMMEELPQVNIVFHIGQMDRSAVGEFSYTALAAAHTMERKMTSLKTRDTYAYLNARGVATGAPPPGYRRMDDGQLVPIDEDAAVVRRVFEMYATGQFSARSLAERLNLEGVRRIGRSGAQPETGGGWIAESVGWMLRNVAYLGKTYTISRDRREGDLIEASWPAIIDDELFASVQRILDRYNHAGRAGRRSKEYLFAGLLICRGCWRRLHARTTTGGARYRCRRDLADGQRCVEGGHAIAESALLPWAEVLMERLAAIQPQGFRAALEAARGGQVRSEDAIGQVDRGLVRLRKLFVWGQMAEDEYQSEYERLSELRAELAAAPVAPRLQIDALLEGWRRGELAVKRELLRVLFDGLVVSEGEIVEYVPRADRAAEVVALIRLALEGAEVVEMAAPDQVGSSRQVGNCVGGGPPPLAPYG
jgi:DNA invertase Pin-like site-specific DNA recombinase